MSAESALVRRVHQAIIKHALAVPGELLVVAVSGGIDSLALLHILVQVRVRMPLRLHVAAFDHGLRGAAGYEDTLYVQQLAEGWGLPATIGQAAHLATRDEAAARKARYDFLATTARQLGAGKIVTAHHADDQAETVLMHLIRGAGLRGLGGMRWDAPVPGHPDLRLIRPLLNIPKKILIHYGSQLALVAREDATNYERTYTRNRIRLDVLPLLATLNPRISEVLVTLAEQAALDQALIETLYEQMVLPHCDLSNAEQVTISRAAFDQWPLPIQRRAFQRAAERLSGGRHTQSYERIAAAVEVAQSGRVGAVVEFPGQVRLVVGYEMLRFERGDFKRTPVLPPAGALYLIPDGLDVPVLVPGITRIEGEAWVLCCQQIPSAEGGAVEIFVPVGAQVKLRGRKPGDTIVLAGMGGHRRRLKEWMIDQKIPKAVRSRIPLLMIDDDVAAILYGQRWLVNINYALSKVGYDKYYFFVNDSEFMPM